MAGMITYKEKDCFVHRLSGLTKLVFFLSWTITSMLTYDTRVLCVMLVLSFFIFRASHAEWRQVASVFKMIMIFLCINLLAIYAFSPEEGCRIYRSSTVLVRFTSRYTITAQQLFYEANIAVKYFTVIPAVFMFITATNPSEFAAALNRIGVHYTIGYSFAIALRYIPDVQNDFRKIKHAQEARGIEMSAKAGPVQRMKSMASILFPLIFTSMDRIDVVSSAMELRGFGKKKKRTWYAARPLKPGDRGVLVCTLLFCAAALFVTYRDGSRFWNPFVP
jgi:ABC-type cobalt transport system, permease component CbiQ and related transporters